MFLCYALFHKDFLRYSVICPPGSLSFLYPGRNRPRAGIWPVSGTQWSCLSRASYSKYLSSSGSPWMVTICLCGHSLLHRLTILAGHGWEQEWGCFHAKAQLKQTSYPSMPPFPSCKMGLVVLILTIPHRDRMRIKQADVKCPHHDWHVVNVGGCGSVKPWRISRREQTQGEQCRRKHL